MFHKAKYVIFEIGGEEEPFVFSELQTHADVARNIARPVVSAGFLHINADGKYSCYGESISLKVKSREQDSVVVNKMLGNSGDDL